MARHFTFFLFIFCSHIWATGYSTTTQPPNPLNGKHLRVIWPRWSGNPKGLSGPLKGGVILEYLAARFNFTYEMVRVTEQKLEPSASGKGLFNYLWNEVEPFNLNSFSLKTSIQFFDSIAKLLQCDLLLQDILPTNERQQVVDITVPWVYTSVALLMHAPDESANINAIIKPFQWPIWVGLAISIVCVIIVLNLLQKYPENQSKTSYPQKQTLRTRKQGDGIRPARKSNPGKQYLYVFGNLLSQSGPCTSNRLSFRFVAGAWSLTAFIFVQAYNSTLLTYVLTPINNPLINSPYDIPERKDVHLLIKKGGSTDIFLSDNSTITLYKKLGEKLNAFPQSRCKMISECITLLTPGSKYVYLDGLNYHKDAITENFKRTGKCNLQLGKEGLVNVMGSFALQKHSQYTNSVNKGLLEIMEAGLIDYWDVWFRPMPLQCMENLGGDSRTLKLKNKKPPALTLKNLTGAFVILLFGFSLSMFTFLCEKIVSMPSRNRRRL